LTKVTGGGHRIADHRIKDSKSFLNRPR